MIHTEAKKITHDKEYLELIASHSPQFFLLINLQGNILFIDKVFPNLTKKEVIGSSVYSYQDKENEQIMRTCIANVLSTKTPHTYEITAKVSGGEPISYEGMVIPIIENDTIEQLGIITSIITERKKTELELIAYKKQYLDILKQTNTTVFTQNKELRYTSVHNIHPKLDLQKALGKTDGEIERIAEKDVKRLDAAKKQVIKEGISQWQTLHFNIDGDPIYYDLFITPLFGEQGEIVGITCAAFDISDREKRKIALENSEERLKEAEKVAHLGYYEMNLPSNDIKWSEETYRIFGIDPKSTPPDFETFIDLVLEEDKEMFRKAQRITAKNGIEQDIVYRIKRPDGSIRHVRTLSKVIKDNADTVSRFFGTIQDVTEQRELGFELKAQKEFNQKIMDISPSLIFIIDIEQQDKVSLNNSSFPILGYTEEEIKQIEVLNQHPNSVMPLTISLTSLKDFIHPNDFSYVIQMFDDFFKSKEGKIHDLEYRVRHSEGHYIWIHNRIVSFSRNASGKIKQILGIANEISTLKEAENTAKHALLTGQEKERQRIAADLHDAVNPLLSAAKLNIESVRDKLTGSAEKASLAKIEELLARAMNEIKDISVNLMPSTLRDFGLSYTLQDYCSKIITGGTPNIDLTIHGLQERLDKPIEITLFRIVQELLNNAIKHADATQVDIQLIDHTNSIILMVEDDGKGFLSSTKKSSNKGFGIQNVKSRVTSLGGEIDIDSVKDRGTIITVEIPLK